jgi:hypothetical protein
MEEIAVIGKTGYSCQQEQAPFRETTDLKRDPKMGQAGTFAGCRASRNVFDWRHWRRVAFVKGRKGRAAA